MNIYLNKPSFLEGFFYGTQPSNSMKITNFAQLLKISSSYNYEVS